MSWHRRFDELFSFLDCANRADIRLISALEFIILPRAIQALCRPGLSYAYTPAPSPVFRQRGWLVEWFSISHTYSGSLKETHSCASIELVLTCPEKPPYTILLPVTSAGKEMKKKAVSDRLYCECD